MTIFLIALVMSLLTLALVTRCLLDVAALSREEMLALDEETRLLLDVAADVAGLPEPRELPDVPEVGYVGDDCERY